MASIKYLCIMIISIASLVLQNGKQGVERRELCMMSVSGNMCWSIK